MTTKSAIGIPLGKTGPHAVQPLPDKPRFGHAVSEADLAPRSNFNDPFLPPADTPFFTRRRTHNSGTPGWSTGISVAGAERGD